MAVRKMLQEAKAAAGDMKIIGITFLTSLNHTDLTDFNIPVNVQTHVLQMANIARTAKIDGVVSSARELSVLKESFPEDRKSVV